MFRYNLLRKNDGFMLLGTYLVISVLIVLAAVLFTITVNEHNLTKKSLDSMAAAYQAQKGIDHVLIEIKNKPSFFTHQAVDQGGNSYLLEPHPDVASLTPHFGQIVGGNYVSDSTEGPHFRVRTYVDPISGTDEIIILAQGYSSGDETISSRRLLVSKYVPTSLYKYFFFSPRDLDFWGEQYDADGGSIHANGWIIFKADADFFNLGEISTEKYFKYYVKGYVPPRDQNAGLDGGGVMRTWEEVFWGWSDPYSIPNDNNTGIALYDYLNNPDGHNYGNKVGLKNTSGGNWDGLDLETLCDPRDYACYSIYARNTSINGVDIPTWLNTIYQINKYEELSGTGFWSRDRYWTYPGQDIDVQHFNSDSQYTDWASFLAGAGLDSIVKDANTGGIHIEPPSIGGSSEYAMAAFEGGIGIFGTEYPVGSGNWTLYVMLNGEAPIILPLDGEITINDEIVFEHETFTDVNSGKFKDNVVKVNIKALKDAFPGNDGGLTQKIIYSTIPVAISQAESILESGLTIVGADNVYLHGNYNTGTDPDDFYAEEDPNDTIARPSAVITAMDVYTLSDFFYGFNDLYDSWWPDPEYVPVPEHNFNYPQEYDFYCPQESSGFYNANCITTLIEDHNRDPEKTTHSSYEDGRNWFADTNNPDCAGLPNFLCMANPVMEDSYYYNVAMVGYRGFQARVLERWQYPLDDNGDLTVGNKTTPPPPGRSSKERTIRGAFIQLEKEDFDPEEVNNYFDGYDNSTARGFCVGGGPAGYCRDPDFPGWYWDMTSVSPGSNSNHFKYETQFAQGVLPPGSLVGFSTEVILELANTVHNWSFHYNPISAQ
ncbi:MAG: hypothetical protein ABH954_01365 [Candidatus Omnitrophota bacterium]